MGARGRLRSAVGVVASTALALALAGLSAAHPAIAAAGASVASSAHASLSAVACPTAAMCLALGRADNGSGVVAARSNGTAWSFVAAATPKTGTPAMVDVSCTTSSSCVAVGQSGSFPAPRIPLMEQWNGATWRLVSVPKPKAAKEAWLTGVSCRGAHFCMVAGNYAKRIGGAGIPFSLRWTGTTWVSTGMEPVPKFQFREITGVSCTAPAFCVAVGKHTSTDGTTRTLVERWNGSKWTDVASPTPVEIAHTSNDTKLVDVSCTSTAFCFSVGYFLMSDPLGLSLRPYALRWNGAKWFRLSIALPPGQGEGKASSVSCASSARCVTAGYSASADGSIPWTTTWTQSTWTTVANPDVSNDAGLGAVACTAVNNCVAVGSFMPDHSSDESALMERFDGSTWSLDPGLPDAS